jgi:hypothetical protein
MKRLLGRAAVAIAAVALLGAAPIASAAASPNDAVAAKKKKKKKKKIATTVTATLRHFDDREIIEGMVDGAKSFCAADSTDRLVQIYRENGATDVLVAETTARVAPPPFGFWEAGVAPQPSGTQFYALAPKDKVTKTKICLEGVSPVVTVP